MKDKAFTHLSTGRMQGGPFRGKYGAALTAVLFLLTALSGCSGRVNEQTQENSAKEETALHTGSYASAKDDLYGGGMVYNAILLSDERYECSCELPVISPVELNHLEIVGTNSSGEGDYEVIPDGVSVGNEYRGWYYYYLHVRVSASSQTPAEFSIDSFDLTVDGEPYTYVPAKMIFYNTRGLLDKNISDEGNSLLYIEAPETILNTIPDDPSSPVSFTMEVNSDCTLKEIRALDFLEVTDITYNVNGEHIFSENGLLSLHKGDELGISFCLQYHEGISDTDLVKTSRIISYEDEDGIPYLINDPQGFLIIGFEGDRMIHQYIDKELLGDDETA